MSRVARYLVISLVLSAAANGRASAATCCVASANVCSAAPCQIPNVGGNCPIAAFSQDCGTPHYCSFDPDAGCQVTSPCTAAKWKAIAGVARHVLRCDSLADAKGAAVDPACVSKALAPLAAAIARADALGVCAGTAGALQDDITALASNMNTAVGNAAEPRTASLCDAKKVSVMSRMAAGFATAMSRAARTANSPFEGIIKANSRALSAIGSYAGNGPGCSSKNSRNEIQDDAVDPFVVAVSDHLAAP